MRLAPRFLLGCRLSEIAFKSLPAVGDLSVEMRIGVFGDLGDTSNSSDTLNHLIGNSPAIVLNTGDLVCVARYHIYNIEAHAAHMYAQDTILPLNAIRSMPSCGSPAVAYCHSCLQPDQPVYG